MYAQDHNRKQLYRMAISTFISITISIIWFIAVENNDNEKDIKQQ